VPRVDDMSGPVASDICVILRETLSSKWSGPLPVNELIDLIRQDAHVMRVLFS
jgi:hypothetical protein